MNSLVTLLATSTERRAFIKDAVKMIRQDLPAGVYGNIEIIDTVSQVAYAEHSNGHKPGSYPVNIRTVTLNGKKSDFIAAALSLWNAK